MLHGKPGTNVFGVLTATNARVPNYIEVVPGCDSSHLGETAALNIEKNEIESQPVIMPYDFRGVVCLYNPAGADIIFDGQVRFAGSTPDGIGSEVEIQSKFKPLNNCVLDTRKSDENPNAVMPKDGSITTITVGTEKNAKGQDVNLAGKVVVLRVVSTNSKVPNWIRVGTKGVASDGTSNLNVSEANSIEGNLIFVKLDANGQAEAEVLRSTDLVVDIQGYFENEDDYIAFVHRAVDSRVGDPVIPEPLPTNPDPQESILISTEGPTPITHLASLACKVTNRSFLGGRSAAYAKSVEVRLSGEPNAQNLPAVYATFNDGKQPSLHAFSSSTFDAAGNATVVFGEAYGANQYGDDATSRALASELVGTLILRRYDSQTNTSSYSTFLVDKDLCELDLI